MIKILMHSFIKLFPFLLLNKDSPKQTFRKAESKDDIIILINCDHLLRLFAVMQILIIYQENQQIYQ